MYQKKQQPRSQVEHIRTMGSSVYEAFPIFMLFLGCRVSHDTSSHVLKLECVIWVFLQALPDVAMVLLTLC